MALNFSRRHFLKTVGLASGLVVSGGVLAACGGGEATPAPAAGDQPKQEVKLEIGSKGEELLFDKDTLTAPANSRITLTFKNNSTALLHNWVLIKPGTNDQVANDGLAAGEAKGYLKENDPNVIAHTKMVKAGESDTITFDAPPKGSYPYICTFPGHHVLMKGTLTIQ
ncbi:MAG: plastocyanin/azurin family copper-binding protein [Anaerolineae bacterium]|nr:plastocyanin/azurin family copper-binding protein [Thermoflexales bacterium]MDW8407109.1 plastocyanin/azurin family copper-binding protein [Anaerolineae bacterium]